MIQIFSLSSSLMKLLSCHRSFDRHQQVIFLFEKISHTIGEASMSVNNCKRGTLTSQIISNYEKKKPKEKRLQSVGILLSPHKINRDIKTRTNRKKQNCPVSWDPRVVVKSMIFLFSAMVKYHFRVRVRVRISKTNHLLISGPILLGQGCSPL